MKLTIENLRAIIKEELEGMQQPCPDLHPKIKSLIIEPNFELFIQAIELYIGMNGLNAGIAHTEQSFDNYKEKQNGIAKHFFLIKGDQADVKLIAKCLNLDKLNVHFVDLEENSGLMGFIKYSGSHNDTLHFVRQTDNWRESLGYKFHGNDEDELLEQMQQPCPDLHPKIKELLLSGVKDTIVQGFELFSALTELDIKLDVHGGRSKYYGQDGKEISDPRIHIEVTGPDTVRFVKCMHFDKLISSKRLTGVEENKQFKFSFNTSGMRYSHFAKSFGE